VEKIDGLTMVRKMAIEVQIMMQHKIDAIKRIMELAENIALDHKYDKDRGERLKEGRYTYYNAKKLNVLSEDDEGGADEFDRYLSQYRDRSDDYWAPGYSRMVLSANKHFSGIPVNISHSSVHVPTNVFDGEPKVINAIDWSRKLDETFKDNYQRDPSLSWQFFGSSTGFLRQYPAMKWLMYEDDPDMYDARMRDWYIKSAASPKVRLPHTHLLFTQRKENVPMCKIALSQQPIFLIASIRDLRHIMSSDAQLTRHFHRIAPGMRM
jgi:hypothetical protein